MIDLTPLVISALAASEAGDEAGGGGPALDHAVETAQFWLAALRRSDDEELAKWTAVPFTYRTDGLQKGCDAVATDGSSVRHWARCIRASKELRLTELAVWQNVSIARGLCPAPLTHLKHGLGGGYWVRGFVDVGNASIAMAFLVVETPGGGTAIRAFVIHARREPA